MSRICSLGNNSFEYSSSSSSSSSRHRFTADWRSEAESEQPVAVAIFFNIISGKLQSLLSLFVPPNLGSLIWSPIIALWCESRTDKGSSVSNCTVYPVRGPCCCALCWSFSIAHCPLNSSTRHTHKQGKVLLIFVRTQIRWNGRCFGLFR